MNKVIVSMEELIPFLQEQLDENKQVILKVKGTSMVPFFTSGVTDVTLSKPNVPLKKYDVVLFERTNGGFVLHRIVKLQPDGFLLEGDAQRHYELVNVAQIRAIVTAHTSKNQTISAADVSYQRQVKRWIHLRPFRRVLLWLIRRMKRGNQDE